MSFGSSPIGLHTKASANPGLLRWLRCGLRATREFAVTRRSWLRTALAFIFALSLYGLTAAPTIYNLDSAELTTAAATGGLMRATGYPLYLLVGRLWVFLPLGDVGYRFNLLSAVAGALTIALVDRILQRLHVGGWAAFGALGLLATGQSFWALSLIAEVYTPQTVLLAGLVLALLRWRERPTLWRTSGVGLLVGLGFSHHASTVLLLPGVAACFLFQTGAPTLKPRTWLAAGLGMALGLTPYLDLVFRFTQAPPFNYAGQYDSAGAFHAVDLTTLEGLMWLVTGRSFAGQMLGYDVAGLWHETVDYLVQLWRSFLGIGLGPAVLGWWVLARRDRTLAAILSSMFLLSAGFFIGYRVLDKITMFLPTYVLWSIWIGIGLQWILSVDWAATWTPRALRATYALIVAASVVWNLSLADQSHDWSTRERGEAILEHAEPDALVFGWWDTAPVVSYLQLVEGQRPDVSVVNRFLVPYDSLLIWIEREASVRPVYIDTAPPELLDTLYAEASGPLVRMRPHAVP